jgi:hypothetical protein
MDGKQAVEYEQEQIRRETELKLEVNQLIWSYAPASMTLHTAETTAIQIVAMIRHPEAARP